MVEMLIVFVIVGILMALSLPKLSRLYEANSVRAAKQRLSSYIVVARAAAIRRGRVAQFRVSGGTIKVLVDSSGVFVPIRDSVMLSKTDRVTVVSRSTTGADSVPFNTRGFTSDRRAHRFVITRGSSTDSLCVSALGLIARRCGA